MPQTPGEESGRPHGETAGRRRRTKPHQLLPGIGQPETHVQRLKLDTGKADVVQKVIISAFQQERGRPAQLQKGDEAGEHDGSPCLET